MSAKLEEPTFVHSEPGDVTAVTGNDGPGFGARVAGHTRLVATNRTVRRAHGLHRSNSTVFRPVAFCGQSEHRKALAADGQVVTVCCDVVLKLQGHFCPRRM